MIATEKASIDFEADKSDERPVDYLSRTLASGLNIHRASVGTLVTLEAVAASNELRGRYAGAQWGRRRLPAISPGA